jgi:hypothetical protein
MSASRQELPSGHSSPVDAHQRRFRFPWLWLPWVGVLLLFVKTWGGYELSHITRTVVAIGLVLLWFVLLLRNAAKRADKEQTAFSTSLADLGFQAVPDGELDEIPKLLDFSQALPTNDLEEVDWAVRRVLREETVWIFTCPQGYGVLLLTPSESPMPLTFVEVPSQKNVPTPPYLKHTSPVTLTSASGAAWRVRSVDSGFPERLASKGVLTALESPNRDAQSRTPTLEVGRNLLRMMPAGAFGTRRDVVEQVTRAQKIRDLLWGAPTPSTQN